MNLPSFLRRKILSIDLGAYEIKVVEGKETNKGIIVYKHFAIPTPRGAYDDGLIVDKELLHYVIDEEFKKKGIRTKDAYLTINSSHIITREIIIPKVEEDQIDGLIKYQLEDYIPMNQENYIVQFKKIGSIYEEGVEKLNILLIAIPKEMVEGHYKLLKDLDLNPLVLDYQPNSIAKLIKYNQLINENYPTEDLIFSAIDIGYDTTKISIIKNGLILVSRTIEIGGKYIDQNILNFFELDRLQLEEKKREIGNINRLEDNDSDEDGIKRIILNSFQSLSERIEVVFRYFLTREIGNEINIILLCGGNANYDGIDSFFSNYFNIPSIKLESFNNVVFDGELTRYIHPIGSIIRMAEV